MQKALPTGAEAPGEDPREGGWDEETEKGPFPWMVFVLFGGFLVPIVLIQMMCLTA